MAVWETRDGASGYREVVDCESSAFEPGHGFTVEPIGFLGIVAVLISQAGFLDTRKASSLL